MVGAAVLTFLVAGGALAFDGNVTWTGNGTHGDPPTLNTVNCDDANTPFLHWVFTDGGGTVTAASLNLPDGAHDMTQNGGGSWSFDSDFFDLSTLVASVDYTGTVGQGSHLTIGAGCTGEAAATIAPTNPSTTIPSQPATDTALSSTGSSGPAGLAWLLVVALGVVLASVVILTPARARGRR